MSIWCIPVCTLPLTHFFNLVCSAYLLASEMVLAVASACCWHFSLAAVATSNSWVRLARLSSSSCER